MDPFYSIFLVLGLVVAFTLWLLPIILFFKVWRMCDDVKRIREILEYRELNNSESHNRLHSRINNPAL